MDPNSDAEQDDVVVRSYISSDDAACKQLETDVRASGSFFGRLLIDVAVEHVGQFDAKVKQHDQGDVLVAEQSATKAIIGVLCVAAKRVLLSEREQLVACVFGTRVNKDWEEHGVIMSLLKEAEKIASGWGAEVLWLSVDRDDDSARARYKEAGYTLASMRVVKQSFLYNHETPKPIRGVEDWVLAAGKAAEMLQMQFGCQDMWLAGGADETNGAAKKDTADRSVGCKQLLESESYLGTFACRCEEDGSTGSVSLWDMSKSRRLWVRRAVVPVSWLGVIFTPAFAICAFALWLAALMSAAEEVGSGNYISATVLFIVLAVAGCFVRFWRPGRFFCGLLGESGLLLNSARLFAPIAQGASGQQMLQRAIQNAGTRAAELGFASHVISLEMRDAAVEAFPKDGGFEIICLQKRLAGDASADATHGESDEKRSSKLPFWSDRNFFDPRDL